MCNYRNTAKLHQIEAQTINRLSGGSLHYLNHQQIIKLNFEGRRDGQSRQRHLGMKKLNLISCECMFQPSEEMEKNHPLRFHRTPRHCLTSSAEHNITSNHAHSLSLFLSLICLACFRVSNGHLCAHWPVSPPVRIVVRRR